MLDYMPVQLMTSLIQTIAVILTLVHFLSKCTNGFLLNNKTKIK